MLTIYGTMLCKDCVACREAFDREDVLYEFKDFAADIMNLKEFLAIRDKNAQFEQVKASGSIGVPCIVASDGTVTLDWEQFLN